MNTKVTPRPVPRPTQASQPFWDGAKKKQLWLQYDPVSRRYQFWPRICSVRTGKLNLRWRKTSCYTGFDSRTKQSPGVAPVNRSWPRFSTNWPDGI